MPDQNRIADVDLTEAARTRLQRTVEQQGAVGIRLAIRTAGCSGFEYVMEYASEIRPDDYVKHYNGFCICIDPASYEKALRGLRLDYQQDALSSGFVFHNPNKTGECGCGQSFTV